MRTFTVKDFINYNAPCFSCNRKVSIKIGCHSLIVNEPAIYLNTTVTATQTEIILQITYSKILNLIINHKTNKFTTSDPDALTEYLKIHKLFLSSFCNHCYTSIESFYLEFNLQKGFIKPVSIKQEMLILDDNKNVYQIFSKSIDEQTIILVDKINRVISVTPIRFVLPLSFLYNLKNKENILKKIKTYLLFS